MKRIAAFLLLVSVIASAAGCLYGLMSGGALRNLPDTRDNRYNGGIPPGKVDSGAGHTPDNSEGMAGTEGKGTGIQEEESDTGAGRNTAPAGEEQNIKDNVFISVEEMLAAKKLSFFDKVKGLALVKKLEKPDIDCIYGLARGGITYGEFEKVRAILSKRLSRKELDRVDELIEKSRRCYAEKTKPGR